MYRIRFHLGQGENFMKWQIKGLNEVNKEVRYLNPNDFSIAMFSPKLCVQPAAANKIYEGACKTVCAWIECDSYHVQSGKFPTSQSDWRVRFNPKESPHWTDGQNILDGETYDLIITNGRELYSVKTDHENDDTTRS